MRTFESSSTKSMAASSHEAMPKLLVRAIELEAQDIRSFELVDPSGGELPAFEAGAHIDVHLPGGLTRQYSLCDPPWQRFHYRIAVLETAAGRGGSLAISRAVRCGDLLEISEPRNLFPLNTEAVHTVLLAGGIGITPIVAMAEQLAQRGRSFELHYCTRTRDRTAFLKRLEPLIAAGRAFVHCDNGDFRQGLDLAELLRVPGEGTHLYYCGPPGFMQAASAASSHWPRHAVHCEYFVPDPGAAPPALPTETGEFQVILDRSQMAVRVSGSKSILQAVREAGIECDSSCETGVCGACRVRYLDGTPEHRDYVLDDEERRNFVLICCARASSEYLVLDL